MCQRRANAGRGKQKDRPKAVSGKLGVARAGDAAVLYILPFLAFAVAALCRAAIQFMPSEQPDPLPFIRDA